MRKPIPLLLATLSAVVMLAPLTGCDGESPTKAIPKTEDRLNDYALTQIYMVPISSGAALDADALKSQIDQLIGQYGEEEIVDKIREIATTHSDMAYRVAAVFSIRPYVSGEAYEALAEEALDDEGRRELISLTQ